MTYAANINLTASQRIAAIIADGRVKASDHDEIAATLVDEDEAAGFPWENIGMDRNAGISEYLWAITEFEAGR